MPFQPQNDLEIEATPDAPGSFRRVTHGLAAHKLRELERVGVPEALAHAAAVVLNNVALAAVKRSDVAAAALRSSRPCASAKANCSCAPST